jgi:cytoskeletal protein RodZ
MKDIGNFLRERREARGISSKYLGIDEENVNQIIQTYNNLEKQKTDIEETKEENIYLKTKNRSMFEKKKFFFPIKYVYLTSFVLIIFIGLFLLNRSLREAQDFPVPSPEIGNETDISIEEKANDISTLTEELIESEAEAIIAEYSTQDSVLAEKLPILKLIANDKTWVKILSEDKIIFEGIIFKGEEFFWETDQALEIVTEYPIKMEAYYNDEIIEINEGTINNYLLKYNFKPTQNI